MVPKLSSEAHLVYNIRPREAMVGAAARSHIRHVIALLRPESGDGVQHPPSQLLSHGPRWSRRGLLYVGRRGLNRGSVGGGVSGDVTVARHVGLRCRVLGRATSTSAATMIVVCVGH